MSRLQKFHQLQNALDISRSSVSSLDPTLSTLSPEDAEVLDAIIAKVPDATAFMTVFKAYSDVLRERGLEPSDDVVYYKKLLKLGVIKAADWGTKWNIVKGHLGLEPNGLARHRPVENVLPPELSGLPSSPYEEDLFTLHSHADETETAVDHPPRQMLSFNRLSENETSVSGIDVESSEWNSERSTSTTPRDSRPTQEPPAPHGRLIPSPFSTFVERELPIRSSTPSLSWNRRNQAHFVSPSVSNMTGGSSRERQTGRIDEADAWKKVELARQLEDADRFRRESLLFMCFRTWHQGLEWIRTTHAQIVAARNQIQLQIYFSRWKTQTAKFQQISERAHDVSRLKRQSVTFSLWRQQLCRKRIIRWRDKMRRRMIQFRQKREEKLRNEAWTRWRQLYLSRQLYMRNVLLRAFRHWKLNLRRTESLELLAEGYEKTSARRTLENVMDTWSRRVQMRDAEKYLTDKVSRKILIIAFQNWVQIFQDNHCADVYQSGKLVRRALKAWQLARANKHALNARGDKHLKRRNDVLLRAIIRVWVSRERGQLLERVRDTRLLKDGLLVWRQRLQDQRQLQDRAISYSIHASNQLLASAFRLWARRKTDLHNDFLLAGQHHAAALLSRMLHVWRLQLRTKAKRLRQAKLARKFFIQRKAWDKWRVALQRSKRERKLRDWERDKLKKAFSYWLDIVRRRRYEELVTKIIQKRTRQHLLRNILQHWTNQVIFIKLRELNTIEQHDKVVKGIALAKWRDKYHRLCENISLVKSYHDVKREDILRRMFIKWLVMARRSRTRRTKLAEFEHNLRLETMTNAWEIWRDRFRENELRDPEYQMIIQSQSNLLYMAFVTWQSRCKSLPGIRFYATNLKTKVWDLWRAAIPSAVQARKAREMHTKSVLTTMFDRWKEAHRKKIALKAVARARYLRLPSPGYRTSTSGPQLHDTSFLRPLLHRPLHSHVSATTSGALSTNSQPPIRDEATPTTRRRAFSSRLVSRPALRAAINEDPSPAIDVPSSFTGGDDRRDKLWNELRGAQLREMPGITRAKSR